MKTQKTFKHQQWHILLLATLLVLLFRYARNASGFFAGQLFGISTAKWFILSLIVPIVHQIYVLVCWRFELYRQSISRRFKEKGFTIYKTGFAFLILLRPITLVLLAISNSGTMNLRLYQILSLTVIMLIPSIYLFYSVFQYFGLDKAFGWDHFYPEQARKEPFVKKGIFKFTSNAMYTFGFFILYLPAVLFQSKAALSVAIFQHLYIWVHYYFTELPDIKSIYKDR